MDGKKVEVVYDAKGKEIEGEESKEDEKGEKDEAK